MEGRPPPGVRRRGSASPGSGHRGRRPPPPPRGPRWRALALPARPGRAPSVPRPPAPPPRGARGEQSTQPIEVREVGGHRGGSGRIVAAMSTSGAPNRLAAESSPYLKQHAANPVDWYPWGEEALERARKEQKPHSPLGGLLRLPLVPRHGPRVLRGRGHRGGDERPLRQRQGGPGGAAGPGPDLPGGGAAPRRGRRLAAHRLSHPGAAALLRGDVLPSGPAARPAGVPGPGGDAGQGLEGAARRGASHRHASSRPGLRQLASWGLGKLEGAVSGEDVRVAGRSLLRMVDPVEGGFGGAPKFPNTMGLELLLRAWRRSGEPELRDAALQALDRMVTGGIHDQLGGGFHRYSVDRFWRVPHFEKMLYDNALLLDPARPGAADLPAGGVGQRGRASGGVARPGDDRALGRLSRHPGRRQRGRGGQVLRLEPRRSWRRCSARRTGGARRRPSGSPRPGPSSTGAACSSAGCRFRSWPAVSDGARSRPVPGWSGCGPHCSLRGRGGSRPGATTRSSPVGTD